MTLTATEPEVTLYATEPTEDGKPHREWLSVQFDKDTLDKDAPEGKREVAGLFIPYGVEIDRLSWQFGTTKLRIEPGSMTVLDNAKTFYGHDWQTGGMPIGRVASSEEAPEGVRGVNVLSKSTKASDVYELCLDGTLDRFSVGFTILAYSVEGADTAEPVLVVTEGEIFECSIVPFPAYDDAAVESVLHKTRKEATMPPTATEPTEVLSKADGDKLSESIETLSNDVQTLAAKLATIGDPAPAGADALAFDSYGEFVKAMCDRDHDKHEDAVKLTQTLAYEGGKVADTTYTDTWVGDITRRIERARKVWNLFEHAVLPAEGMKLEYGRVVDSTIDVEQQLLEGDAIVMGKIEVGTDHADVITFGGGAEQSFQQVKRSSINVVDFTWGELARAYAKATEAYARLILGNVDAFEVASGSLALLDTADGWVDFLVDTALHFDELGLPPDYLRLTPDQYKVLAKLRLGVDGPYVLDRTSGSVNLMELTGNVGGLTVTMTPGVGLVEVGSSHALKTFESAGAPARLGPDEDILHLTQAIGVYGFDAIAVQEPEAIVRATA